VTVGARVYGAGMFAVELVFADDDRRLAARPAHREYLAGLKADGRLVMAGPWTDDSGALLLFDTDRAGVDEILATDPYYVTPGVTVAAVHEWRPIIGG
jgi:uncharacterized protein